MKSAIFWDITPCSPFQSQPTSRRNMPPPSSGSKKISRARNQRIFRPWRWRRYVPQKRRLTLNGLHGVISQKMARFIITAVRTSNPAKKSHDYIFCVLFNGTFSISRLYSVGWYADRWIGRDLEKSGCGLIEVLSRELPGGTEEIHKKNPVSIVSVPAEAGTEHLPNTSLERYLYTSPFIDVYITSQGPWFQFHSIVMRFELEMHCG
jgi:hypothetical protein